MPVERVEQSRNAIRLEQLAVHARCRDGAFERQTVQGMIVYDEHFVIHRQGTVSSSAATSAFLGCRRNAQSKARSAAGRSGLYNNGNPALRAARPKSAS